MQYLYSFLSCLKMGLSNCLLHCFLTLLWVYLPVFLQYEIPGGAVVRYEFVSYTSLKNLSFLQQRECLYSSSVCWISRSLLYHFFPACTMEMQACFWDVNFVGRLKTLLWTWCWLFMKCRQAAGLLAHYRTLLLAFMLGGCAGGSYPFHLASSPS